MSCTAVGLLTALLLPHSPLVGAEPAAPEVIAGKVLPLAKALEKLGVKPDADSPGVALLARDNTLHSLVKDETSRLLFLDPRLQDRPVQLTARRVPGTQFLRVTAVHTVKDGKLHDVYYWCENCQLRSNEPGPCKCCGGETALRKYP
jgi:hypothetical protein